MVSKDRVRGVRPARNGLQRDIFIYRNAQSSDFDCLNLIHIAGTKGKGSTSAFISSILAQYLPLTSQPNPRFHKIGLYTSPHLRFVRERIQINNEPLSEETFAKYFFQIWDRLEDSARVASLPTGSKAKPGYFRFLTLMAFHTYISEGVDTAVIECGIGGEYDGTNIIVKPRVTGITSLGIDHVNLLGSTIEEIAWHKAGIMKPGVPAFTVPQPAPAQKVLEDRAAEKSVILETVSVEPEVSRIPLGLAGDFQFSNASLAVRIASAHLQSLGDVSPLPPSSELPAEFKAGLLKVHWPGRCEIRREKNINWHIDSGHTTESIQAAATWFASQNLPSTNAKINAKRPIRILLFNQQTRDASALVRTLHTTLAATLHDGKPFTHTVFCSNLTFRDTGFRPDLVSLNSNQTTAKELEVQKKLAKTWRDIDDQAENVVKGSIEEAVEWIRSVAAETGHKEIEGKAEAEPVQVLVTGSVHLVGGFLEVLESGE